MQPEQDPMLIGNQPLVISPATVEGATVHLAGETYYCIRNYDRMPPFFMSLVSSSDHWLFISSTGGLTAGRIDAESALFPYETDDKIAANAERTGTKTIVRVTAGGRTRLWEPFSERYAGLYACRRNLYKSMVGNKLIFEEINDELRLSFRYGWQTGDRFGFIKRAWLENNGETTCRIDLLDGLQNMMPYGATSQLQTTFSNLLNAYKRSEIEPETGLGIFALSATLSDRAEPSESLKATVAWQAGLAPTGYLLSADQVDAFRQGRPIHAETDIRGRAGAYLVNAQLTLTPNETRTWYIAADVNQDSRDVLHLVRRLRADDAVLPDLLEADSAGGTEALVRFVASADGLQSTADEIAASHHFANVLFNIMRGGIFIDGYHSEKQDFMDFVLTRNRALPATHAAWFDALPDTIDIRDLHRRARETGVADLERLALEYLPLIFSRRHGDPSRPWNRFAINLRYADGTPRLDYQGNWRDIFQNWEPLALSYPDYAPSMIAKFLNATTADGYNPYRLTRDGIEWEVPEPDNPWANIGYWSDHQIIYLQKLLEIAHQVDPTALAAGWNHPVFAYADVPYRLRPYAEMLEDWYNTIDFDWDREREIEAAVAAHGTDGRLRRDADGSVIHGTMTEKLLVLLLAKLTNLVPEGGIWMNTQRPEWNDANNALVGKGLSVVTTAYLRRFVAFWLARLEESDKPSFDVGAPVVTLMSRVQTILSDHQATLASGFNDGERRTFMDAMGAAATTYRAEIYSSAASFSHRTVDRQALQALLQLALRYLDQTLRANRRSDALYHAYNILVPGPDTAGVDHLYVMLEGQVAILSSGLLSADEVVDLLHALRDSDLYRADQHSYMLYPNRDLPGFLAKNVVTADRVAGSALVAALAAAGDQRLLIVDDAGNYHFNGTFRNAGDAAAVLDAMAQEPALAGPTAAERAFVLDLFEETFNHRAFTGRSGTFFAYEGLGSIYWHMVAKLLLAVQECHLAAREAAVAPATLAALETAYHDIRRGLGFNKSPAEFGAFPTDPYSHTPLGSGARQPGMTGQVKEEILTRWGELGIRWQAGGLTFAPTLLQPEEFHTEAGTFSYRDLQGDARNIVLPADSLAFTVCQVPVIYTLGDVPGITVVFHDDHHETLDGVTLPATISRQIFGRNGHVRMIEVVVG